MASLPPSSLTLETKNFLIRPITRADVGERLSGWADDELAAEMLNTRRRQWRVEDQAAFFARFQNQPGKLALGIIPRNEQHPIGFYSLHLQARLGVFTISHLIGDPHWRGKNITTETSDAIYGYLFDKLGYAKAKANVRPQNRPMLWLMLSDKTWRKEARLVQHLRDAATGERRDILVLGMMADDWRAAHQPGPVA